MKRIVSVAHPRKVILFGSAMDGEAGVNSDLDVLVVVGDETENLRQESVRIRRALGSILMPMDILVVAEGWLRESADQPGLIYREALRTGKLVYEDDG